MITGGIGKVTRSVHSGVKPDLQGDLTTVGAIPIPVIMFYGNTEPHKTVDDERKPYQFYKYASTYDI